MEETPAPCDCEQLAAHLDALLDGELSSQLLTSMELHLDDCNSCSGRMRLEQAFRNALRRAEASSAAPEEMRLRMGVLLQRWRQQHD